VSENSETRRRGKMMTESSLTVMAYGVCMFRRHLLNHVSELNDFDIKL
jgi:hypothetical protein